MEISEAQYEKIAHCLPKQRGHISISGRQFLNAMLYVAESGCTWRRLPPEYGDWHTVYVRMNRWARTGVLEQVLACMQQEGIVSGELVSLLISRARRVDPDGSGG